MKVYAIDNRLENTGGQVNRNERKNRRYHTHFSVISRTNFLKEYKRLEQCSQQLDLLEHLNKKWQNMHSITHVIVTKTDYILGHKTSVNHI